jgi:plasmid maintenance system killer protein
LFRGEALTRKEVKKFGQLNFGKARTRLITLDEATEKRLILLKNLYYHSLAGTKHYSIDADSRKSPWRITFTWSDEGMENVEMVKIENTH